MSELANLLTDPWITVRRRSGVTLTISPAQITDGLATDPIVDIVAPRPDFRSALYQFCIGLLQTTCMPDDDDAWLDWWDAPPEPRMLDERLAPFRSAFVVAGDGPLFMQDRSVAEQEPTAIGSLLMDEPGAQGIARNTDLFVKRNRFAGLPVDQAMTALITMQCMAPAGGAGHRTSLRGGGPLTTLLLPAQSEAQSLWRQLWLNILSVDGWALVPGRKGDPTVDASVFPWLAQDLDQGKSRATTTPAECHSLQHYWSMPRRILLGTPGERIEPSATNGKATDVCLYRSKPWGLNYEGPWIHPLSPYYRDKQGGFLPVHPQPGGFQYQSWHDWAQPPIPENPSRVAATVVSNHLRSPVRSGIGVSLWASGHDMDNMKPRCFYQVVWPIFHFPERHAPAARSIVESLSEMASDAARSTRSQVRNAWLRRPADHSDSPNNASAAVSTDFHERTESDFFRCLAGIHAYCTDESAPVFSGESWRSLLHRSALATFDSHVAIECIADGDAGRIARARNQLERNLNGKTMKRCIDDIANAMAAIRPEGELQ